MSSFIFDENFTSKKLIRSCRVESLCDVKSYPKSLRGVKDPEMLPVILSGPSTLVTLDAPIVDEHRQYIPQVHCGLIIVRQISPVRTMATKRGQELLSLFKQATPKWSLLNYRNVVLRISERDVVISCVKEAIDPVVLNYTDAAYGQLFDEALERMRQIAFGLDKPASSLPEHAA